MMMGRASITVAVENYKEHFSLLHLHYQWITSKQTENYGKKNMYVLWFDQTVKVT